MQAGSHDENSRATLPDETGKNTAIGTGSTVNRWLKRLGWLVFAAVLLSVASWVLVPPILKSQLEKLASAQLGRQLTVGKIDFKPWTLELTLHDMALAKADGSAAQIQVKRLYANASMQSLRRLAPVLDALQIEGVDAKLTHLGQGKYDIDDILARLARPAAKPVDPNAPPPGFAVFNIALTNASLDFVDKTVGKTHEVRALNLSVPFLSNLDTDREVKTEPRLALRFNGSVFDSQAASTPFKDSHKTDAAIKLSGFDLKPYLAYLPPNLPVRLVSAMLDADLKVAFEQTPRTSVKLSGTIQAKDVQVQDTARLDLLAMDGLKLVLEDVRPLEQSVKLSMVELNTPKLEVRRDKSGRLNLAFQNQTAAKETVPKEMAESKVANKPAVPSATNTAAPAWRVDVAKIALGSGQVNFSDETTQPIAKLALRDLQVDAQGLVWPFSKPVEISGSAQLVSTTSAAATAASLKFDGNATDQAAHVNAELGNVALSMAAPYLAQFLEPQLSGSLSTALTLDWKPDGLKLAGKHLTVAGLVLGASSASSATFKKAALPRVAKTADPPVGPGILASLKKLEILDVQLDLAQQALAIGKVNLLQPGGTVERDANQHWMFERWFKSASGEGTSGEKASGSGNPGHSAKKVSTGSSSPEAKPWALSVKDIQLDGGSFAFMDKSMAKPVALDISAVKASLKEFALDGKKPFPLTLSLKLKQPQGEPGQLDYKGDIGLAPLSVQGSLAATQIPVHAFEPYFGAALNVELLRADAGFKGNVKYVDSANGAAVRVSGDSVVEEFRAHTMSGTAAPLEAAKSAEPAGLKVSEELLTWKALSLRGLEVALAPGTPTTVTVAETALTDFFARVQIDPTGRINLQDLVKPSGAATASAPVAAGSALASAAAVSAGAPEAVINIGPVSLINGKVFFSDHFIRPNYSANLSELNGRLSAFSSVAAQGGPQMADLELRGRAEGTAALEILGKLNPLAKPLALDIKAKVRDLELPPLSPYSVKYAGHGIERGKLSVDLAYVVLPDGQLDAKNKIILNQLKFGDKVEGAPASLPVRLAVALLADRNGVIDLDLPVSGSLNDPQFSLGPIIFKVIVNVIVKAITAPFSLLASAFGGGGDELGKVPFEAGSAVLGVQAQTALDKVAKALLDRPALKMTVVGLSSLEDEREAYKQERLKGLLLAEKRRAQLVNAPAPPQAAASAAGSDTATARTLPVLTGAEEPALIKEVYRRADFPKARNLVGIAKDIPVEEMRALLLANIVVTENAMRELALQRGVAVKDYLASKQLPVERLFLGGLKTGGAEAGQSGGEVPGAQMGNSQAASAGKTPGSPEKWAPRAELNLATN